MNMKKLTLADFSNSELSGYSESELTELFAYYKTNHNEPTTVKKFIHELEKLTYAASAPSLIEFVRHGPVTNISPRFLNGNPRPDLPTKYFYQITEADAGIECNLRMRCFIVAGYVPYDDRALQRYRSFKSYNCFCRDKRCMSLLKNIRPPKHLVDRGLFEESERGLVDRMNTSLLEQYYDARSPGERGAITRAFNRTDEARNKIQVFKSIYPEGDPLGTYSNTAEH